MAKLNISNKKLVLPTYSSFKASTPTISVNCDLAELVMRSTYYFDGNSSEPKIGDKIFTDINGLNLYNNIKKYLQFKVDANNRYFYKIEDSKIKSIESCNIIDFVEFDTLDQTNESICQEGSFFPDNLTDNAETFYHDGDGQYPSKGDKVYLSKDRFDTLNNFIGLFNILNGTYYYLYTDNIGQVYKIKTCQEIISIPTRSISLKSHRLNTEYYNIFRCAIAQTDYETLYFKSELDGMPEEGSLIYSDQNLTNLVTESSYFIKNTTTGDYKKTVHSLLVDENGKASYTECSVTTQPPEPEPEEPDTDSFYFNVILIDFCEVPSRTDSFTKIYYEDNAETGANFVRPSNGTKVFKDEALTIPYNSSTDGMYGYLYRDGSTNTTVYALFYNDEISGTRTCNNPDIPDPGDGGGISVPGDGDIGVF